MIGNKVTPYARARAREGRPSKYRIEHCEIVVALGSRGASITQMARSIGVSRSRLYAWERQHPDFRDAIACARVAAQAWWEEAGQKGILDPHFNTPVYAFEMCRRFPADYSRNGWSRSARAENPSAASSTGNARPTRVFVNSDTPANLTSHGSTYTAGKGDRDC